MVSITLSDPDVLTCPDVSPLRDDREIDEVINTRKVNN